MSQPTERPYVIRELANRVVVKTPLSATKIPVMAANNQATDSLLSHSDMGYLYMDAGSSDDAEITVRALNNDDSYALSAVLSKSSKQLSMRVYGSTYAGTQCGINKAGMAQLYGDSAVALLIHNADTGPIVFGIDNAEYARLDSNCNLLLKSPGMVSGYTDDFSVDTYGAMRVYDQAVPTDGGLDIWGISDAANIPGLTLTGLGVTDPDDAVPVMNFRVGIANGSGGMDYVGDDETAYQFLNNDKVLMTIMGNGAVTIAGTLCGIGAGTIPMGSASAGLAASSLVEDADSVDSAKLLQGYCAVTTSGYLRYTIRSFDTTAQAAGVGGGIAFGGYYTDAGAGATWAGIKGIKENGTSGQYGGHLIFETRANGGANAEVMRLTAAGNVDINGGKLTVDHIGEHTGSHGVVCDDEFAVTGAFSCNGAAVQTAYASGGAIAAYGTGAFGFDSDAHASELHAMVVKIRAALVANGTMS